jgi:hypothetical protein
MTSEAPQAPPEQITYANLLFYGSWAAIAVLIITFAIYVSGVLDSYVPINELAQYWSMPVKNYVHENSIPTGWGWATLLGKGDFLNFIGIALLAGTLPRRLWTPRDRRPLGRHNLNTTEITGSLQIIK